jgi:peptidoglycan/LPS O-acetylase OafA/YrhL
MTENILYNSGKHMPVLDGVRGLAVLLVVLFHFFSMGFGWLGVDLFFVLSGFLITGILIDSKGQPHYFRNFYARRTLRIFPLYYFVLILFFILINADAFILKDRNYFTQNMHWYFLYIQNWLYAFNGWPRDHALNHFWSLAIEEQFYLFWPLLVYLLPVRKIIVACIIFIVISIAARYISWYSGSNATFQFTATFCRLDGLSIGAVIAVMVRLHQQWLAKVCKWLFIITIPLIIVIYLLAGTMKYDNYYFLTAGFTIFDLFFGGILISCFLPRFPLPKKFFSMKWMIWLGKYSYGIYVYHWIIYQLLWPYFREASGNPTIADVRYIYGTLCIVLTLITSFASYHLMEAPLLKLKSRFS